MGFVNIFPKDQPLRLVGPLKYISAQTRMGVYKDMDTILVDCELETDHGAKMRVSIPKAAVTKITPDEEREALSAKLGSIAIDRLRFVHEQLEQCHDALKHIWAEGISPRYQSILHESVMHAHHTIKLIMEGSPAYDKSEVEELCEKMASGARDSKTDSAFLSAAGEIEHYRGLYVAASSRALAANERCERMRERDELLQDVLHEAEVLIARIKLAEKEGVRVGFIQDAASRLQKAMDNIQSV